MFSIFLELKSINLLFLYLGRTRSRSNERRSDRRSSRDRQDSSRRRSRERDRGSRRTGNYRGENDLHNNGNGPHDTFGITDAY